MKTFVLNLQDLMINETCILFNNRTVEYRDDLKLRKFQIDDLIISSSKFMIENGKSCYKDCFY